MYYELEYLLVLVFVSDSFLVENCNGSSKVGL